MAAPPNKTTKDLSGKWTMNKSQSDSIEPALALQGVSFIIRMPASLATVYLDITAYEAPPKPPATGTDIVSHIDIVQSASGLTSTQENRTVDGVWRPHKDWLFGEVRGRSVWVSLDDVDDEYLRRGYVPEEGKTYILSHVESINAGWTAMQVWGFQQVDGLRKYTRNIVVTKGDERVQIRFVYDWTP